MRGLVSLHLNNCRNLVSIPSSITALKYLKTLVFSGCSILEILPVSLQQLESLERLNLMETATTKPASFNFELKNLEFLSLRGCKVMQRSMNSVALTLPPLSGLTSLTRLHISYCNLCEGDIPSDICSLSSLEVLKLDGNKIISLPANLDRLSNLYHLGLDDCTELKSLPDLLASTFTSRYKARGLWAGLVRNARVGYFKDRAWVSLINCQRLGENTNVSTLLKKHLKAYADVTPQVNIILPGSEIPEWFSHQRDGYSIKMPLPPDVMNDSQCIGVAFCCVCVNVDASCSRTFIRGRKSRELGIPEIGSRPLTKYHLWLRFWSRKAMKYDYSSREYQSDELKIEAEFKNGTAHIHLPYKEAMKCGIRIIYERDLEEMENIEGDLLQICNPNGATLEDIPRNAESKTGKGALLKRKREIHEEDAGASESDSIQESTQPKWLKQILNVMTRKRHKFW